MKVKAGRDRLFQLLGVASIFMPLLAHADNWFMLDGVEPPDSLPVRMFGLLQPTYQQDFSRRVGGLVGTEVNDDGKFPVNSLIAPGYKSTSSFYLFRVRLGSRGAIDPETNYEAVAELGANALTTQPSGQYHIELAEGSITYNHLPGARFRFGLFKTPGPEEGLRTAIDYVNFTSVTSQLINYQPVSPVTGTPVAYGGVLANASSGVRAFRDTGIQIFDDFRSGQMEYTYAAMIGNGSTLNQTDDNSGKTTYWRVQATYLFDPKSTALSKNRDDVTAFIWRHDGKQNFNNSDYSAVRDGVGVAATKYPFNFTAEYKRGSGMIYVQPLFAQQAGTVFVERSNKSSGWYLDGGYFVAPKVKLGVRYDVLDHLTNVPALERSYKTLTFGGIYWFSKASRIALNYEIRKFAFPGSVSADGDSYINQRQVGNAIGNRVSVQATLTF